jgi:hypothetical protein
MKRSHITHLPSLAAMSVYQERNRRLIVRRRAKDACFFAVLFGVPSLVIAYLATGGFQ